MAFNQHNNTANIIVSELGIKSSVLALLVTLLVATLFRYVKINNKKDNNDSDGFDSSVIFVGIDCEMVGVGKNGEESMLARCSLVTLDDGREDKTSIHYNKVNNNSSKKIDGIKVLYDVFVRPTKPITDYRTKWSGITKDRLKQDDVISLQECRRTVLDILTSSSSSSSSTQIVVLVGHALKNDLDVLNIQHPYNLIRDTAYYPPYMKKGKRRYYYTSSAPGQRKSTQYYPRKLAELSKEFLGMAIQSNFTNHALNSSDDRIQVGHDSIEDAAASLLLYKKASLEWEESLDFPLEKLSKERQKLSNSNKEEFDIDSKNHKDFSSAVLFVGMDCEMVGVGRHGIESMLARCSIVTLIEDDGDNEEDNKNGEDRMRTMRVNKENFQKKYKVKVLYDAYIRPTRNITDYRTQWSGITKERLEQDDVITLQECRRNVLELLSSSADGRLVVLVGHALKNDFEVLNIQHPYELIRDTASYHPYMRPARKRHYPRKLSELCREKLGIHIQNNGISKSMYDKNGELNEHYQIGHDSVEDAAASLLLYNKASLQWEKSLKFPLQEIWKQRQRINVLKDKLRQNGDQSSFITLYLDGCNLPLGLRQRKDYVDPKFKYQLLAKNKGEGKILKTPIDWLPLLRSMTSNSSSHSMLPIGKVCIFFDGKMFTDDRSKVARPQDFNDLGEGVYLEISDDTVEVDDVLVERCVSDRKRDSISLPTKKHSRDMKSIEDIIVDLQDGLVEGNEIDCHGKDNGFYVVKRKAGGRKTNKKLFDKLCLRRAEEGAFCLMPSLLDGNPRLQKNSLAVAKQLQQAKVNQLVEYERRLCKDIRSIVVTDDVLLSDRVVNEGGVVLRYYQLKQLI